MMDLEAFAFKLHKMGPMERVEYVNRLIIEAKIEEYTRKPNAWAPRRTQERIADLQSQIKALDREKRKE